MKLVKQETEYWCGPAAVSMALQDDYFWPSISQSEWAQFMGTTTEGTGYEGIKKAFREFNGTVGLVIGTEIRAEGSGLAFTIDALLKLPRYWVIYDRHRDHWMAAQCFPDLRIVTIHDPEDASKMTMTLETFVRHFLSHDEDMLIC